MTQGFFLFLAFLVVLGFPSTNLQLFDGLPISRLPEFAALAAAIPFLIFSTLRARQSALWEKWKARPAYLWMLLGAGMLIKVALFASGAYAGFSGCYRSPAEHTNITHEDLPEMECERSYENLFHRYPGTRLDPTIQFGPADWNLVFLNTNRYNFYEWEPGTILRSRIPIEVRWSGDPDVKPGESIRIEYTGEGSVVWGEVRVPLPAAYQETEILEIASPREESLLQIQYSYDDGSRSGQDTETAGPSATIRITSGTDGGQTKLETRPAGIGYRLLALLADLIICLWVLSCLPAFWVSTGRDRLFWIAFVAGIAFFSLIPMAPVLQGIGITIVLVVVFFVHLVIRPLSPVTLYIAVIAASIALIGVRADDIHQVLLRSAGNDPLTYESQAYSILATGSLRGGEPVFWAIPAYRYFKFFEHAIFGDGDMLYAVVQLAAFLGGVFHLFRNLACRVLPKVRKIFLAGLGCGLIFLGGYYVSSVIVQGLSEYDTWTILLWVLPGLYGIPSSRVLLTGIVALAVSYIIRPNQLPGFLWIYLLAAFGSWRKHAKTILLAGVLGLGIALLPLAHNVYFGHQWMVSTNSGTGSANLVLPPTTWLAFLRGDPGAAAGVRDQIGTLFLVTDAPRSMLPTLAIMATFLISWIAVTAWAVVRRKISYLPWLALPLVFLSVHFFYDAITYFPRHIFIAYLSMALITVLTLLRNSPTAPAEIGRAVE